MNDYETGGTIHFIVNNQIGFTTTPRDARSSLYCTDLAKTVQAPIFHVNADDIEAVIKVSKIAAEYRTKFKNDVVVDIIGYRKFGHNELDQPSFTQPLMYQVIKDHPGVQTIYRQQLLDEGVLTPESVKESKDKIWGIMNDQYLSSKNEEIDFKDWENKAWQDISEWKGEGDERITGIEEKKLAELGIKISTLPEDLLAHNQIKKIYGNRVKSFEQGKGIDWGTAEALAFGSLIQEGFHVRISGQDVERGTFSHRHAVIHD